MWRGTKIIIPPQLSVIALYFGLKIARITIADNIKLTNAEKKRGKRENDLPLDTMKIPVG